MVEQLTVVYLVFYLLVISKHWEGWYLFGALMQVLIIIGYVWLPESPEFYFAKGRFEESKLVLLRIAAVNGRNIGADSICFDHVQDGKSADEANQKHCRGTLKELW